MKYLFLLFLGFNYTLTIAQIPNRFVSATANGLVLEGAAYRFIGTNLWQAVPWAASDEVGRARLCRELDRLQAIGVNNLRIMSMAEGPASAPWRFSPTMTEAPDSINQAWLIGLDYVLVELSKRKMKAVLCLGNFWPWSGGFAQYLAWAAHSAIPYPPPAQNGSWSDFEAYSANFYKNKTANTYFRNHAQLLLGRINSINNLPYAADPTIMAWQLANEPRYGKNFKAFYSWVRKTARFIKKTTKKQLLSIGIEGIRTFDQAKFYRQYERLHQIRQVDYLTMHLWPENWGWYRSDTVDRIPTTQIQNYIQQHLNLARTVHKPIILEEFGLARDGRAFLDSSTTTKRDAFYSLLMEMMRTAQKDYPEWSGLNFWAWSGEGRPSLDAAYWQLGDAFTGDPPHEPQGWYSVYNSDSSTLQMISKFSTKLKKK
jgi:mannan endo-1,4-beta-mannosidase